MNLKLEVFIAQLLSDRVRYRRVELPLAAPNTPPDHAVRDLVEGLHPDSSIFVENYLSHSTSWRYEANGNIVLTYLVCLDDEDFQDEQWQELHADALNLAGSDDACQPTPRQISEQQVLSHAIRHLAFLQTHTSDQVVQRAIPPRASALLSSATAALAGQIY